MSYTYEQEKLIEKAISFLVESINTSGHNSKPVILHTIRVATYLYRQDQPIDVVVGALLHDIIEDTQVTIDDVRSRFGEKVASLVMANTFKSEIQDYVQKYIETFERNIQAGQEAALIKAADLLDNSYYYQLGTPDTWDKIYGKYSKFIEMSEPLISSTPVWKDLKTRQDEIKKILNIES